MRPLTPAEGLRSVLRRRGWSLRHLEAGRILLYSGSGSKARALCEFTLSGARPGELGLRLLAKAALRPSERADLERLRRALRERLSSSDRTGLGESHRGSEGDTFVLRTTFACNQRCPFCFVPLTGRVAPMPDIERELDLRSGRPGKRRELTLSGGEPTLDPRLPRIVEAARARGFRRFVLQTNAVLLSEPRTLRRILGAGVRDFMVSFHSHRPDVYDEITASRGQHRRAVAGLQGLLASARRNVTVNVVVNARNVRDLPALVGFLARLRRGRGTRLCVYFSMINEAGHQNAPAWAVDLAEAAPFLREALARCRREGIRVSRFGGESCFPPCLLDRPGALSSLRELPQERIRYASDFSGGNGSVGRAKLPACRTCRYDRRCSGVPASYARLFGLGALRPVR